MKPHLFLGKTRNFFLVISARVCHALQKLSVFFLQLWILPRLFVEDCDHLLPLSSLGLELPDLRSGHLRNCDLLAFRKKTLSIRLQGKSVTPSFLLLFPVPSGTFLLSDSWRTFWANTALKGPQPRLGRCFQNNRSTRTRSSMLEKVQRSHYSQSRI